MRDKNGILNLGSQLRSLVALLVLLLGSAPARAEREALWLASMAPAARRIGRPLMPAGGAGAVLVASLALLLFLSWGPIAPAALWALAPTKSSTVMGATLGRAIWETCARAASELRSTSAPSTGWKFSFLLRSEVAVKPTWPWMTVTRVSPMRTLLLALTMALAPIAVALVKPPVELAL